MPKEDASPQVVKADLDRFMELLFGDSETYRLALKLYAGRYEVIGARDAAEILRQVIDDYLPREGEQPPESDE